MNKQWALWRVIPKLEYRNPKQIRNSKFEFFNLVILICFVFRYSYFEFMERIWNDYRFSDPCRYREKRRLLSRGDGLLKEALDIVEKGKDHEAEEQQHSNLLGKLTLAISEWTTQDGFTGKEKEVASI